MQAGSLSTLAAAAGLDLSYVGFDGKTRQADGDVLRQLAQAILPRSSAGGAPSALGAPRYVILRQPESITAATLGISDAAGDWRIIDADSRIVGSRGQGVPASLPCGIYSVLPEDRREAEVIIILAPRQAYQLPDCGSGGRTWLIAVQLYGIRSERNWGHGDFTDLAGLIRLAAETGAGGIGLNPLHALFPAQPAEASPYSPSSRVFLNPLYIDVTAVPGYPADQAQVWQSELVALRATEQVDYPRVMALKRHVLRLAFDRFLAGSPPVEANDFAAFREQAGTRLRRFAAYEVLCDRFGASWRRWPDPWRNPDDTALSNFVNSAAMEIGFVEFQQWQAQRQLEACRELGKTLHLPVGLYLDFAVGIHPDGFDVWEDPEAFLAEASVGAPPDLLNRGGQDWGLACFNPKTLQGRRYEPFRRALATSMRFSGALRFDHVLGLNRLYLIPRGGDPRNGAYLRYPAEELLAVMACESTERNCLVIGEDLGTVPEGFRGLLEDWGIWTYLILLFARTESGDIQPPADFPARALAAFNTHDLPTFAGWWAGRDLEEMRAAGLTLGESEADRQAARRALQAALSRAVLDVSEPPDFSAVARLIARSPCGILAVAAEDLTGSLNQPNMPGTWKEYPNWRWRLPVTLEELRRHPGLAAVSAAMAAEGRSNAPAARNVASGRS